MAEGYAKIQGEYNVAREREKVTASEKGKTSVVSQAELHNNLGITYFAKGLFDAMEGILFTNDSRIADSRVIKQWSKVNKIEVYIKII